MERGWLGWQKKTQFWKKKNIHVKVRRVPKSLFSLLTYWRVLHALYPNPNLYIEYMLKNLKKKTEAKKKKKKKNIRGKKKKKKKKKMHALIGFFLPYLMNTRNFYWRETFYSPSSHTNTFTSYIYIYIYTYFFSPLLFDDFGDFSPYWEIAIFRISNRKLTHGTNVFFQRSFVNLHVETTNKDGYCNV